MLLEDKAAVIYGAGGAIGGAVARAFAREGAAALPDRTQRGEGGCARRGRSSLPEASRRPHTSTLLTSRPCKGTSTQWSRERAVLTSRSTPSARAPRPIAYP